VPTPSAYPEVILEHSGYTAQLIPDRYVPGGFVLSVDGVAQSQVTPGRPELLTFEYIRRIGNLIDLLAPAGQPLSALHLGAGALTLPRYLAHTRPGSRSQVIEWEKNLIDFVREHLPWDSRWSIRVRYGDARDVVATLPAGLHGALDLIVVDLFSGNQTPSHLTTKEFYALLVPLLGPTGVIALNLVDGRGSSFAKAQAVTLRSLFGFVGAYGEAGVVRGRRFGNMVMVATRDSTEPDWWPELIRRGPHPTGSLAGEKLERFSHGVPPQLDAQPMESPTLSQAFLPGATD
jgi:spermidine synthase